MLSPGLREIRDLAVWCDNLDSGCSWQGIVSTLEDHVTRCGFTRVSCPNGCLGEQQEPLQILKKDIDGHLQLCPEREHRCAECGLVDAYRVIVGGHDEVCHKKIVVCPNEECSVSLERGMVEEHVQKTCKYTEVACKYASIGCAAKVTQGNHERHEKDMEIHFYVALDRIVELMQWKSTPPEPPPTAPPPPAVKSDFSTTLRLTGYAQKKLSNDVHYFQSFFTHPMGYLLTLYLYANGQGSGKGSHLSVYLKVMNGVFDFNLAWPLTGSFTIELLNQVADANHYRRTLSFTEEDRCHPGSCGWGYSKFISLSVLNYDPSKDVQYLKDDHLFLRVICKATDYKSWLSFTHE